MENYQSAKNDEELVKLWQEELERRKNNEGTEASGVRKPLRKTKDLGLRMTTLIVLLLGALMSTFFLDYLAISFDAPADMSGMCLTGGYAVLILMLSVLPFSLIGTVVSFIGRGMAKENNRFFTVSLVVCVLGLLSVLVAMGVTIGLGCSDSDASYYIINGSLVASFGLMIVAAAVVAVLFVVDLLKVSRDRKVNVKNGLV